MTPPAVGGVDPPSLKEESNEPVMERFEQLNDVNTESDNNAIANNLTVIASQEPYNDQSMITALETWLAITHNVMDYKYIGDLNTYVRDVQEDEKKRLGKQRDTIHNDIMITKRMYLMRQRNTDMLYSRVRVILHCMLFVSIVALAYMNRAILGAAAIPVIVLMALAFSIYIIMYIKVSSSRRYDDWNKLYWNSGNDSVSEDGGDADLLAAAQCSEGSVGFN
jgi:hypothetical protein